MTDVVVVEGQVRLKDGKKWKSRWVALRKPSPVADCLVLQVYKDKSDKTKGLRERSSITLEDICGLEPGLSHEGVSYTLSIICLSQAVVLGFESKEALLAWDIRICYSLGEVHRFTVGVLPGTKLESGPATLHLCNNLLVITRDLPPTIIGQWNLPDLRRYGAVPSGFVFEGGTRCGYWAGVFFLSCAEGEQISFLFDCIVRGISPTRGPFGLRPALPDPSANAAYLEERLNHEAQELEKRLSLLSHGNQHSSTAFSVAGDDRSISSSSDTSDSHSDTSMGSRLAVWAEPVINPTPADPPGASMPMGVALGEEKPCPGVGGGARPPPKPPRSRRLREIGRQGSSDSGIATGSHSSYSGSFSSYAGSLDIGQGEEFGSLLSLPLNFSPEHGLCTCQPAETPRDPVSEYQVPCSLRHLYDRPRSLFLGTPGGPDPIPLKDQTTPSPLSPEPGGGSREPGEACANPIPRWLAPQKQGQMLESKSREAPLSAEGSTPHCEVHSLHPGTLRSLFAACPICGGLKGTTLSHSGLLPMPVVPDKARRREERHKASVAYEIVEEQGVEKAVECEDRSSYELMASCGQQKTFQEAEGALPGTDLSVRLKPHRGSATDPKESYEHMASSFDVPKRWDFTPGEFGGVFLLPADATVPDKSRGDGVTYINIPVSPTSNKQLHYMELELQEIGSGVRGSGTTKYAHIDIAATETAHRVGTQHAQGREDRLQELEQKRRGALQ
ncbi:hypothetical protein AAFF_G00357600 [Aldrovandia affinis]|uniref:PH domain-containing protein n=1 Tax=Aldrovandia affinis TaxID=143900 RepID=A0AAD7X0Y4_9TELE|nr:hypothetical protein AAFF_G00357600 [Aldrovandia affinis]